MSELGEVFVSLQRNFKKNVEQNITGRQAIYENIIWCSFFTKRVKKARDSGLHYLKFTDF